MNKYKNKKVVLDNIKFDSRKEARRYAELKLLEKSGEIKDLRLQTPYELIPSQYAMIDGKWKCIERPCKYIADFTYIDCSSGQLVVEDTKGMRTKEYVIKRKLMFQKYGIMIKEI